MKLKDLVKKLEDKPQQNEDVQFVIWTTEGNSIVCIDMSGPMTIDLMKVFAKHTKGAATA